MSASPHAASPHAAADDPRRDEPVVVVSCDSHVGPRLATQLRAYCPERHLRQFDDFVTRFDAARAAERQQLADARDDVDGFIYVEGHPNTTIPGHHDIQARLADMDRDGVAAEVIYHFSKNGEPLPFVADAAGGLGTLSADPMGLAGTGLQIYNRWLADFVSVEPERHVGLAYLPLWDIAASVRELERAAAAGLRGVNFPPPNRPGHLPYNHPDWDPFWSACEALGMSLNTHSSGAAPADYFAGPGGQDILIYECGGWMARRAIWWLIHGQVFERHPRLRLVITEQYEGWWTSTLQELDSVYLRFRHPSLAHAPRLPSEYARTNVFMGASFMSRELAVDAWRNGYAGNVLWGRDYPHDEGTFQVLDDLAAEPISRLSLRHVLSQVPARQARMMAGENAVAALNLDAGALRAVAARIGAPTGAELATAPGALPVISSRSNAFRGQAGARPLERALLET
jgi:predicted TIM-barrel fold metal-dependent hydrolase